MAETDPPIDESTSLGEVRKAMSFLKDGRVSGVSNISAELFKGGSEAMVCRLTN